jgi:hypothetical protein
MHTATRGPIKDSRADERTDIRSSTPANRHRPPFVVRPRVSFSGFTSAARLRWLPNTGCKQKTPVVNKEHR